MNISSLFEQKYKGNIIKRSEGGKIKDLTNCIVSAKISAKSFVREYNLIKRVKELGQARFRMYLDKTHKTKENFYVVKLEA